MKPSSALDPSVFKSRLFWKFFGAFLAIFFVTVVSIHAYLVPTLQGSLKESIKLRLTSKIFLLKGHYEVVDLSHANASTVDKLTDDLSRKHLIQISVLNEDGRVVGDSSRDVPEILNNVLGDRPEFIAARNQEIGSFEGPDEAGVRHAYLASRLSHGFIRVGLPLESVSVTRGIVIRALQVSFLPALVLSILLGIWMARRSAVPIKNLLEIASRISQGEFSLHYHRAGDDELNELGEMINRMAKGLEDRLHELAQEKRHLTAMLDGMMEGVLVTDEKGFVVLANRVLLSMFTYEGDPKGRSILECFRSKDLYETIEQVRVEGAPVVRRFPLQAGGAEVYVVVHSAPLKEQNALSGAVTVISDITDVKRLETFRKEFVANVSHELKTPLTSIRGYAETLLGGASEDPETSRRFLEKILRNATQLQNLVEDLLELSAMESGKMPLKKQLMPVEPVLKSLQADYADWIKKKQISLDYRVEPDLSVLADPQALKQILRNLLDNAIKYTPDAGSVTVTASKMKGVLSIVVKDSGIGIAEKDQGRIFERFFRSDQSRSRDMGGTGLGLAIVKHLISNLGWDIKVESKPGSGSAFTVLIPSEKEQDAL